MTHVIECGNPNCRAKEYVDEVPAVWFCGHLKIKENSRWVVCPNCSTGKWLPNDQMVLQCDKCQTDRQDQRKITIVDYPKVKPNEIVHNPSEFELLQLAKTLRPKNRNRGIQ